MPPISARTCIESIRLLALQRSSELPLCRRFHFPLTSLRIRTELPILCPRLCLLPTETCMPPSMPAGLILEQDSSLLSSQQPVSDQSRNSSCDAPCRYRRDPHRGHSSERHVLRLRCSNRTVADSQPCKQSDELRYGRKPNCSGALVRRRSHTSAGAGFDAGRGNRDCRSDCLHVAKTCSASRLTF